ncbi:putative sugar uptake ABC transporter permease protein [Oceanicola granulosus HTCC2516]|uniref:Putative sugar uptake ABC transporter permease protein n=1 Tax=Oceanicola granulosus (strain ATCC BAA-861 / DSM 15982 / KCTC 12143 / HTCC2516) TaxID=314256 RepID=Q2CGD2_OCEGH|nr:carbohydrate ABC transporter permease [Oceanicola granulosus]EAR51786.1 putative sugar uptake ABC transporter permease protein [Oceanicola granulosus HTCC2516]
MTRPLLYGAAIFMAALFVAPFVWTLLTAVKTEAELYTFPPSFLPETWRWENFHTAWTKLPFTTFLTNSTIVVVLSTVGQLFSSSLVAFGFARFRFPGRDVLFVVVLASMMIPWDVKMIPLYMQFNFLGWINTLKPLIVPAWFGEAFFIFLLRQYIMSVPMEIDEAARMDGANSWQLYWRIHLPLMLPALVLVGTFQFMNAWNDYLGPLIFLNDQSKYTLTLGLSMFKGLHGQDFISIAAITVVLCLPPLVLFFFAQRYIMDSALGSSVKG